MASKLNVHVQRVCAQAHHAWWLPGAVSMREIMKNDFHKADDKMTTEERTAEKSTWKKGNNAQKLSRNPRMQQRVQCSLFTLYPFAVTMDAVSDILCVSFRFGDMLRRRQWRQMQINTCERLETMRRAADVFAKLRYAYLFHSMRIQKMWTCGGGNVSHSFYCRLVQFFRFPSPKMWRRQLICVRCVWFGIEKWAQTESQIEISCMGLATCSPKHVLPTCSMQCNTS